MAHITFDHIAIALPHLAAAPAVLVGELGGRPYFGMTSELFRFGQWRFEGGGRIEILEPYGEEGFLHRFLAQHGPGIHHVTFKVPSLREACDRAEALGYGIVGYKDVHPEWKEAFLHPKQAMGIVVQLAQSTQREDRIAWQAPPGPPNPPPPVTLLGLRVRARDRDRARGQWEGVLQGACVEQGDALIYRWPHSPLRVVVEIDPEGKEGPVGIEYMGNRPDAAAHALRVLGSAFIERRAP
ncbi:MAG: VOC family protein [Candidatus Rokuibacteriota bacterium]